VQLDTTSDLSQAAGAMHPLASASQATATLAHTYCAGVPTGWQA